jgi:hypothetical protein
VGHGHLLISGGAEQPLNLSVKAVFWTLPIVCISIKLRFGSWIFFRLQVKKKKEGQKP